MRIWILAVAMTVATAPAMPTWAQKTAAPAAPSGKCAALGDDWKEIEIGLGVNKAEGFLDDSAPRATMRAAQDTAGYARAQLTLELMEAAHCALPPRAPSDEAYFGKALACQTATEKATNDQLKAGLPECDRKTW